MNFQDLWNKFFLFFSGSCVIRKLLHSSWWELEKKTCVGWRWDGQRSLGRQCPFCWCVCVCLWGGGWAGFGIIRYQILLFYDHFHYCEIFLARFLISFVFNKAVIVINKEASIVLNRILSFHIVWFSLTKICIVTKRMRDKTIRKVNKWPVTKVRLRFSL